MKHVNIERLGNIHPLRKRIIITMFENTEAGNLVMSPSEVARKIEEPLPTVSYHVKQLVKLGTLKLTRKEPRRGAVEHYYELQPDIWDVDSEALDEIAEIWATNPSQDDRTSQVREILQKAGRLKEAS